MFKSGLFFSPLEGRTDTLVDFFRSEAGVGLDFLKDESFKHCLSGDDSFGGPPGHAVVSCFSVAMYSNLYQT